MKKFLTVIALAAATVSPALAQKTAHDHVAKHGGIFVEGKEADYELVAKPDAIQLYVNDHGKPMDVSKASAIDSATMILNIDDAPSCRDDGSNRHEIAVARSAA